MKHSNLPIVPSDSIHYWEREDGTYCTGLTKREHFVLEVYKTLLGHEGLRGLDPPEVAVRAIYAADCLIEALRKDANTL